MYKTMLIYGTLPPPIGGVTIHTLRLISLLEEHNFDYKFVDLRPKNRRSKLNYWKYFLAILNNFNLKHNYLIHYQLNNIFELFLIVIISKLCNNKIITTIHSFRPELFNFLEKILFNLIKLSEIKFIAPTKTIKKSLVENGVENQKIEILDTFLPPSEKEIYKKLPDEIINYVKNRDNIVVANAYKLYKDNLNTDVYGLDMCIEACNAIPEINFIYCVPLIEDYNYFQNCIYRIKKYDIENRFMIINQNISLVSLFKYTDLFVRPTSSDSFGISVAESISMGVPAIASDVCERAKGAITFKSRNTEEFINKIKNVLKNKNNNHYCLNKKKSKNYIQKYINLYKDI